MNRTAGKPGEKTDSIPQNGQSNKAEAGRKKYNMTAMALIRGWIPAVIILTAFDQLTKYLACRFLKKESIELIPHVFRLEYLENRGAAFGMMSGKQILFILFALLVIAASALFFSRLPGNDRTNKYRPLRIVCCVVAAGAAGNMLDRLFHQYVIDFLYFSLIDFPVFNVADVYVVLGCLCFLLLLLFYYKEEDLDIFKADRSADNLKQ